MCPVVIGNQIRIPPSAYTLKGFRRWVNSDQFPEEGSISYIKGDVWVDLMERFYHNQLKSAIGAVLFLLVQQLNLGRYAFDRMRLINVDVDFSHEPDGMFFFHDTLSSGVVKLVQGDDSLEVLGAPDMVLEVVSQTSVQKDTVLLRELYWEAGIQEYWLVDAWRKEVQFEILRRGTSKYVATRKQSGWVKSQVFGKSFQLVREPGANNIPEYRLEVR